MKKYVLATDLDGTFVGDADAFQELCRFFDSLPYTVDFVYLTGRHVDSALSLIHQEGLPFPQVLVTDVGA